MVGEANTASASIYVDEPSRIRMAALPECESGPFVAVRVEPVAALLIRDVAVLDALAVQVAAARDALAAILAGQDPLPDVEAVAGVSW